MLRYSCDLCGQPLGERRFVVKLEVYPAYDPEELGQEDLDADIAFVGMPFDQGTFERRGTRYCSDGLRDARTYSYLSFEDGTEDAGYFRSDLGMEILKGITMDDCSNISVVPSDVLMNFQKLTNSV